MIPNQRIPINPINPVELFAYFVEAQKYGIDDLQHATNYLRHPVLGKRLLQCTRLVLTHQDKAATQIFSEVDALKFRSCMTLFKHVPSNDYYFRDALMLFFMNEQDPRTRALLGLDS